MNVKVEQNRVAIKDMSGAIASGVSNGAGCNGASHSRAVVSLSLGTRPFVQQTRPLMEAYAARVGAAFHFVRSLDDPALRMQSTRDGAKAGKYELPTRFLKLPLLRHFLERYARVMYLDDDVIVSLWTPDLFAATPCNALSATVEWHKPEGWHAQHWRSACQLYGLGACKPKGWRLFNSGVMLLSRDTHSSMLSRWPSEKLECRVLCDQLYLNAVIRREGARVHDLGAAFNFVGSELVRAVTQTAGARPTATADPELRRSALRGACLLHLTRKVPKLYTADWVVHRALGSAADVLQCSDNATGPPNVALQKALLTKLPSLGAHYEIGPLLCGHEPSCAVYPWAQGVSKGRHRKDRPPKQ